MIYPVALGRTRPPLFAELATLTGGRSFHVTDPKRLPDTLRAIAGELHEQYLLGYTPSRPLVPGGNEEADAGLGGGGIHRQLRQLRIMAQHQAEAREDGERGAPDDPIQ